MSPRLADSRLVAELQRKTEEHFYGDTASILQDTLTSLDGFGQPVVSTASTSVSCSFTDKPKVEKWEGFVDISQIAAEIRYDSTPVPVKGNRVTLTGRFDSTDFVDTTFEIIGIQDRDVFGHLCALMLVTV